MRGWLSVTLQRESTHTSNTNTKKHHKLLQIPKFLPSFSLKHTLQKAAIQSFATGTKPQSRNIKSGQMKEGEWQTHSEGGKRKKKTDRELNRKKGREKKCVKRIINPCLCVCVYTCAVYISVCVLTSVCADCMSTSQGHCWKLGREGKKLTRPVDNDVSPARNTTLKGTAQTGTQVFAGKTQFRQWTI